MLATGLVNQSEMVTVHFQLTTILVIRSIVEFAESAQLAKYYVDGCSVYILLRWMSYVCASATTQQHEDMRP